MANLYERHTGIDALGSHVRFPALGSPAGVTLPLSLAEMLRDLVGTMGLPEAGIVTPWAGRTGDVSWQEIVKPDTNIALFGLTDALLGKATQELFGTQLPFIAVVTNHIQPSTQILEILEDAPYEFYQTQAVYSQADPKAVPSIQYLHWLKVKDLPDQPKAAKSLDQVAAELGGSLRYGQQVPVESTTVRPVPTVSFEQARNPQSAPPIQTTLPPIEDDGGATVPVTASVTPAEKLPWLALFAVGTGIAFATVAVGRALKK